MIIEILEVGSSMILIFRRVSSDTWDVCIRQTTKCWPSWTKDFFGGGIKVPHITLYCKSLGRWKSLLVPIFWVERIFLWQFVRASLCFCLVYVIGWFSDVSLPDGFVFVCNSLILFMKTVLYLFLRETNCCFCGDQRRFTIVCLVIFHVWWFSEFCKFPCYGFFEVFRCL